MRRPTCLVALIPWFTFYSACDAPVSEAPADPAKVAQAPPPAGGPGPAGPPNPTNPQGELPPPPSERAVPASGVGIFEKPSPTANASAEGQAPCVGCDVVLITMCSLRQDHVGAYGHGLVETPAMDSIAARGTRFTSAYAASNFTLASLTAILTGRYGSHTGVVGWDKGLVSDVPTLPEVLGYYGYRTAAVTTDAPSGFRPDYGLDRGFSRMEIIPPPPDTADGRTKGTPITEGGTTAGPVVDWLAKQTDDTPIFLMFHDRTAHFPFMHRPPEPGTDPTGVKSALYNAPGLKTAAVMPGMAGGQDAEGVKPMVGEDPLLNFMKSGGEASAGWNEAYAASVEWADRDIARVMAALEERGRLDRTVLVLVADHGESLWEHDELLHGMSFYDGVIKVPLVISVPGLKGPEAEGALVSHVDVLPTILQAVGATVPADIDGTSMLPLMRGEADEIRKTALSEGGVEVTSGIPLPGAVISPPWTLLYQSIGCGDNSTKRPSGPDRPSSCLYDMRTDAGQEVDVSDSNGDVVDDLLARWEAFRLSHHARARQLDLSPELVKELKQSGYDFRESEPSGPK